MNNKGFIVSTILYTILIAFLLFLGVTLSIFSSATSTVGAGTKDLVNSEKLTIKALRPRCGESTEILAVITSKYGEFYWPKDFMSAENHNLEIICKKNEEDDYTSCNNYDINEKFYLGVRYAETDELSEIYFEYTCK